MNVQLFLRAVKKNDKKSAAELDRKGRKCSMEGVWTGEMPEGSVRRGDVIVSHVRLIGVGVFGQPALA